MVQIENCIKYFNKLILNELKTLEIEAWVAGGAVRDYFSEGFLTSDIDLYFSTLKNFEKCKTFFIRTDGKIVFENDKVIKFKWKDKKIDLVKTVFNNPQHSIDSFDFTVCCAAVDNDNLYYNPTFFIDLSKKQLMINKLDYPISTLWRLQKYNLKGFRICKGELTKIIEAIQNSKPINTQNESEIIDNIESDSSDIFKGID